MKRQFRSDRRSVRRPVCFSVGFLLFLLLLAGCANTVLPPEQPAEISKTTSEKIDDIISNLPKTEEFQGKTLTVLTSDAGKFVYDENAAGTIKNAIRQRNELLQETYEVELSAKLCEDGEAVSLLKEAVTAGVPAADLLCFPAETTVALQTEGLLQNLFKLPYFDRDIAVGDAENIAELTYGVGLYLLPDPSALAFEQSYVLFYNRDLVEKAGLALPEAYVRTGEWTEDRLRDYAERIAASVMSKSSFDYATDTFGLGCTDKASLLPDLLRQGLGLRMIRMNGGKPEVVYGAAELDELTSPLKSLYNSASRFPLDGKEARNAFEEGRLGFFAEKLPYLYSLFADSDFRYGVLPLPKQNVTADYRTPLSPEAFVFSVPTLTQDDELSGVGMTAICSSGRELFREAVQTTLLTLYSSDNDQSCMVEIILNSLSFDFGTVYGTQISQFRDVSSGLFTEVIANGARFKNELYEKLPAFTKFADANFDQVLDASS